MKSIIIVAALTASVALAGPLARRQYTTITTEIATVTITASPESPSQTGGRPGRFHHGGWDWFGPRPSVSTDQAPSPSPSFSAASTSSQVASTTRELTSMQPESSSTATASTQLAQSTSSQSFNSQVDNSWQGEQPYSMSYAQPIIDAHNSHRANHSVPNLKWNHTLEIWSQQISATCYYAHSKKAGDGQYGQNIGAGFPAQDINRMVTDAMYNGEIELYPGPYGGEPNMTNFEAWGHYSQIVWATTLQVGCYTTDCSAQGLGNVGSGIGQQFTVCNYYPPGNYDGEFGLNVPRPGHMPTITIN